MNWPHFHLVVNHVLVIGSLFLFIQLAVAVFRDSRELKEVALWGIVILGLLSVPIKYTGDWAAEAVLKWPDPQQERITAHETASDQATTCFFLLALLAGAGLYALKKRKPSALWLIYGTLAFSLLATLMVVRTANLGGQIRHPETRPEFQLPQEPPAPSE